MLLGLPDAILVQFALGLATIVLVMSVISRRKRIQRRCFAWFYGRFVAPGLERELRQYKTRLFHPLTSTVSADPCLSSQGPGVIRLLEIGIGTGLNLEFYPQGCRLVTVEPNKHFDAHFERNRDRFGHVTLEKVFLGCAEDMSQVSDNSVDVVVSTYVLCSVVSLQAVLKEVLRVLTPGGKFYFVEHIPFESSTWSRRLQNVAEPVWSFFSDDCKLTSTTSEAIANAGFARVDEERLQVPGVMFLMRPHVVGVATK